MTDPSDDVPLLTEKVIGFRKFSVHGEALTSIGMGQSVWWPGLNIAHCTRAESHRAPHPDCECGLYALHERPMLAGAQPHVLGVVTCWGQIDVHHSGVRAEFAEIVALSLPSSTPAEIAKRIQARYDVPVVSHADLAGVAKQFGEPVPKSLRPKAPKAQPVRPSNYFASSFWPAGYTGGGASMHQPMTAASSGFYQSSSNSNYRSYAQQRQITSAYFHGYAERGKCPPWWQPIRRAQWLGLNKGGIA